MGWAPPPWGPRGSLGAPEGPRRCPQGAPAPGGGPVPPWETLGEPQGSVGSHPRPFGRPRGGALEGLERELQICSERRAPYVKPCVFKLGQGCWTWVLGSSMGGRGPRGVLGVLWGCSADPWGGLGAPRGSWGGPCAALGDPRRAPGVSWKPPRALWEATGGGFGGP